MSASLSLLKPSVTVRGQFSEKSSISARTRRTAAAPKKMRLSAAVVTGVEVKDVPTTPIEGQKTGTSGLRKKAAIFSEGNYLGNWVQSLFLALPQEEVNGSTMVLGGDGRGEVVMCSRRGRG